MAASSKQVAPGYNEVVDYEGQDEYSTYNIIHAFQNGSEGQRTLARSSVTGSIFVVKHLMPRRLPHEAIFLLDLLNPHPNIVEAFGTDRTEDGGWNLHLEYCSGGDLCDQVDHMWTIIEEQHEVRVCPEIFALHVWVHMAHALAYLHNGLRHRGNAEYAQETWHVPLIHADIKLENILLRFSDTNECGMPDIVLADFGLSIRADKAKGYYAGSENYCAPEIEELLQYAKRDPEEFESRCDAYTMTTKTDMYSLGVVMWYVVTGRWWPTAKDPKEMELPGKYASEYLKDTVAWCLQVSPEDRPDASLDLLRGLLGNVDGMREERDLIFKTKGPLPDVWWQQKPQSAAA